MSNNSIFHYGVLGMKWGVRRNPEQLARTRGHIDSASGIVKEAKNINNAVNNVRSSSKRKNLSSMSDKELRDRVNRMNMEQQYSMLSANNTSRGQSYVKSTLEVAGSVLAIASSAVGTAVAIRQLKG